MHVKAGSGLALLCKHGCEPEVGTFALGGFKTDFTAHQFDKLFGYDQPQAGAPEFAGHGAVCLGKRLKQPPHTVARHAHARVDHLEVELGVGVVFGN